MPYSSNHKASSSLQACAAVTAKDDDPTTPEAPWREKRTLAKAVIGVMWLPEIISLLLALLALLAIIILLALRKDKPLPNWPSLLNINSLVAIFSSMLKAALLFPIAECINELKWLWFANHQPVSDFDRFDSASRGPWGALKLLLKHPSDYLTSLGAAFINNLSIPITAAIREVGDLSNSTLALGETFGSQTCVGVDWAWLALPATLLLLTMVFLVTTAAQAHRYTRMGAAEDGRRPWKSSSLPFLWHGLSDETRAQRRERFDEVRQMQEYSDVVKVRSRRGVWIGGGKMERDDREQSTWFLSEEAVAA